MIATVMPTVGPQMAACSQHFGRGGFVWFAVEVVKLRIDHATKQKVAVSSTMDDSIERWTANCEKAWVVEITEGNTKVAEAGRTHDLAPSEIEGRVDNAKPGMKNAHRAEAPSRAACQRRKSAAERS